MNLFGTAAITEEEHKKSNQEGLQIAKDKGFVSWQIRKDKSFGECKHGQAGTTPSGANAN